MICSAEGCGAGLGFGLIAIAISEYYIAELYFNYKKEKE